jgi:hypothetical protein
MSRSEDDGRADRDIPAVLAVWRIAGVVLSQTALLTALLFYFGWARSRETYAYFGVDVELLDFSTSDYLLRSVNSAFRPLMVLGLLTALLAVVHGRVSSGRRRAIVPRAALGAGVLSVAIGLAGIAVRDFGRGIGLALPISLAAGFSLMAYADLMWWRAARQRAPAAQLRTGVLLGLALLGLFWSVSLYAVEIGRDRAETLHRQLRAEIQAVVFSERRLSVSGRGVQHTTQPRDSRFRHRYSGLLLLAEARGRYFLLPVGWVQGDSVFLIPEADDIRLDFQVPGERTA